MPTRRERSKRDEAILDRLRGRILSGIHSGRLNPGDRLPTYRDIAGETGLDLRGVMRLYGALEEEGLVEVRGRSGVFVASQERIGGKVLAETARWMVGVLREAWQRRVAPAEFSGFVERCTSFTTVRCVCVETTQDQLQTLCHELEHELGYRSTGIHAESLGSVISGEEPLERLPKAMKDADVIVTTAFHASALRPIAERLQKPMVSVRLSADIVSILERHLDEGILTVVHLDPEFPERLTGVVGPDRAKNLRFVPASDRTALRDLDPDLPTLVTTAARNAVRGVELPESVTRGHTISADSAGELIELLLRANLEAMSRAEDATPATES